MLIEIKKEPYSRFTTNSIDKIKYGRVLTSRLIDDYIDNIEFPAKFTINPVNYYYRNNYKTGFFYDDTVVHINSLYRENNRLLGDFYFTVKEKEVDDISIKTTLENVKFFHNIKASFNDVVNSNSKIKISNEINKITIISNYGLPYYYGTNYFDL